MAQQAKDQALSLLRLWSLLWQGVPSLAGNVQVPQVQPKKKRKEKEDLLEILAYHVSPIQDFNAHDKDVTSNF